MEQLIVDLVRIYLNDRHTKGLDRFDSDEIREAVCRADGFISVHDVMNNTDED